MARAITAIVMAKINGPTPSSEYWKICGIYSAREGRRLRFDQLILQLRAMAHRHVPTEEPR